MQLGIDYAWGTPPYDACVKAGVKFVVSYISTASADDVVGGKDMSLAEVREWHKRGVGVGLVFEIGGSETLQGHSLGKQRGEFSKARAKALNLDGIPIFFAVDFDATASQMSRIGEYFKGARDVLGYDRMGDYGGIRVVDYMERNKICRYHWQTLAWSGGHIHPAAHMHQFTINRRLNGLGIDFDHSLKKDFGCWGPDHKPIPGPKPTPPPKPHKYGTRILHLGLTGGDVKEFQRYLNVARGADAKIDEDGDYGPKTESLKHAVMYRLGWSDASIKANDQNHSIGIPGQGYVKDPGSRPGAYMLRQKQRAKAPRAAVADPDWDDADVVGPEDGEGL